MKSLLLAVLITCFTFCVVNAQFPFRIEAEYSIKEKSTLGHENLLLGKVYYDKNFRQQVFDIKFPESDVMIINDTATIMVKSGGIKKHKLAGNLINFSILNLFLHGDLEYFGLQNTPYELTDVERDKDLVISTWEISKEVKVTNAGRLLLSQKNGLLNGLITYGIDNQILSKQIFSEYIDVDGLSFPSQILQISYLPDGTEVKRVTKYKNLKLNNTTSNAYYNFQYSPN